MKWVKSAPFWVALSVGFAPACSAIWGFEDGTLAQETKADASVGPTDAEVVTGHDARDAIAIDPTEESPEAPPECKGREIAEGLFVDSGTGSDDDACGTANAPCQSIGKALTQRAPEGPGVVHVYVGVGIDGQYLESVVVPSALRERGVWIEARWFVRKAGDGRQWLPYCGAVQTRIASPALFAIQVEGRGEMQSPPSDLDASDASGDAEAGAEAGTTESFDLMLSNLAVASASVAGPGESLYALQAKNARVRLSYVTLTVAEGGAGQDGAPGDPGPDATNPVCASSNATTGSPGDSAQPSGLGTYGPDGYVAASSSERGDDGGSGTAGSAPAACNLLPVGVATSGCGGAGGKGGLPGTPGGGSMGLYLSNSHVTMEETKIVRSAGGRGGAGGMGGDGGDGKTGNGALCVRLNLQVAIAGTTGAPGGPGGRGPAAAGGPSHCIVALGDSSVQGFDPAACNDASGGSGGDGLPKAADGLDQPVYPEGDGGTGTQP